MTDPAAARAGTMTPRRRSVGGRLGRATPGTTRIAIGLVGAVILMTLVSLVLLVASGQPVIGTFSLPLIASGLTFPIVGGLIASRQPDNRIGWVILLGSLSYGISLLVGTYGWFAVFTEPSLPGGAFAAWVDTWVWMPGEVLLIVAMPILFPDGHLPSPRWRWVVGLVAIGTVVAIVSQAIGDWPLDGRTLLVGDSSSGDQPGPLGLVSSIAQLIIGAVGPLAAVAAVIVRLRRSVGIERQQMRWFTFAAAVMVVTLLLDELVAPIFGWPQGLAATAGIILLPVAIAIAILRYRLYEIDRIISRTVSYAIVTGILAFVFVGAILLSQAVLSPLIGRNAIGVAGSTLVVIALFQPLRSRVQRVVDRRFDRSRYDAERTLAAFASRLRDDVDLDSLGADIGAVVHQTVAPTSVAIWFQASAGRE